MREETRRKLDEKLNRFDIGEKRALLLGAILCVLAGLLFVASKTTISNRETTGVVQRALWRIDHNSGQSYPDFQIVLDDGRLVVAGTLQNKLPPIGAKIIVRETTRATGYHSYSWGGAIEPPEQPQ